MVDFAMAKPRYESMKNKVINGRCTVNELRCEIRKEFKDRIYTYRSKQVDARRQVLDKNMVSNILKEGFNELQATLLTDKEAVALLDTDSVFKILGEVQEELLQEVLNQEAEAHEDEIQREMSTIVEDHLSMCSVCERLLPKQFEKNIICQECALTYFSSSSV